LLLTTEGIAVRQQDRSQVLKFGEEKNRHLGGKIFVFILCLKQSFLGTPKFGRHKKHLGV